MRNQVRRIVGWRALVAAALLSISSARSSRAADCDPAPSFVQVPIISTQLSASKTLVGAVGGTVQVGRFTLIVPPGAIQGTATITVQIPDPSVMRCDLSIAPASANGFKVPVLLVGNLLGAKDLDPLNVGTLWYDPARGCWVSVPGALFDPSLSLLRTPLWHFSKYGIQDGKAGW